MKMIGLAILALTFQGCDSGKAQYQKGIDDGYLLGASDAVKRSYWIKQSLEWSPEDDGDLIYYTVEFESETEGDTKKVSHKETRRIRE